MKTEMSEAEACRYEFGFREDIIRVRLFYLISNLLVEKCSYFLIYKLELQKGIIFVFAK